ncbi:ASCH domain-containing protein [Rhizobium laguerreae]|uniref:ASCH domain-containing protein n=1 Tax=Rhizobium laguerreae TaxID=1076926 RepID=UPI001C91993C|nr:ASCH domain-containing protein [Rhizobium laguerreae]MBY3434794.1 ASCH domain-containing protein [Rhizobium laguerreae]MBY3448937.1 ASCH domain-containing protein [Rhizobium laguerreae]MBY3456711.1 ASCH domain-containing protein [Rhizobium laguerreae]
MADIVLPLKREYFEAIKNGTKTEEYRDYDNTFWRKRIEGKSFDRIILTLGYPKADDTSRRLVRQWRGYEIKTITHPHFGNVPTTVFAIDVEASA